MADEHADLEPVTLAECETRILTTGARLVLRPATPGEGESDLQRGVASLHYDAADYWWRGHWNRTWHFAASEGDLRELLAADLEAGRVSLNPRAVAREF